MHFREADRSDFAEALPLIRALWTSNTYEETPAQKVYEEILQDPSSFIFFLIDDDGDYVGMCHGTFFPTLWMSGLTCYVSGLITRRDKRRRGYGHMMMDHVVEIARARGSRAVILDSAFFRKEAHQFYENYGFEKSCYSFEMML